ncbi:MAG TPA: hypothetical protein VF008_23145 [Niastella sp.]
MQIPAVVHSTQCVITFTKELKRTGVTKQLQWEEYRKLHPNGYGKSQFDELLKRHEYTRQVSMRYEYKPAEHIMIDFAGDKLYYTDRNTGEVIGCQVLVCVLPFSGYSFVIALLAKCNAAAIGVKGLNAWLAFFGGASYFKKHCSTTLTEHMHDAHKSYREQMSWDKGYFLRQAEKIGRLPVAI